MLGVACNWVFGPFRVRSSACLVVVKDELSEDYGRLIVESLPGIEVKIVHRRVPLGCPERGYISIGEALLTDWVAIMFPSHCMAAVFSNRSRKIFVGHGIYSGKIINGVSDYVYGFKSRLLGDRICYDQMVVTSRGEQQIAMEMAPAFAGRLIYCKDPVIERLESMAVAGNSPRKRIFVASSWGQHALLGQESELDRIFDQLSLLCRGYDVTLSYHSRLPVGDVFAARLRQFQAEGGQLFVDRLNWTQALAAADLVVCDHSSVAMYAALLRKKLLIMGTLRAKFHPRAPIRAVIALSVQEPDIDRLHDAVDRAWHHDMNALADYLGREIPELSPLAAIVPQAEGDLSRSRPILVN
jgi:hypothetical protein